MSGRPLTSGADLAEGLRRHDVWRTFAFEDVRGPYRRSHFWLFWILFQYGAFVLVLSLVFHGLSFQSDQRDFLVYLSTGYFCWMFITGIINESASSFIQARSFVCNIPLPLSILCFQVIAKNGILTAIRCGPLFVILLLTGQIGSIQVFPLIGGIILLGAAALGTCFLLSSLAVILRDIVHFLQSVMSLMFFVTPIIWDVAATDTQSARYVISQYNPFTYFLSVVRMPVMGEVPAVGTYAIVTGATGLLLLLGWLAFRSVRPRIALLV